MCQWRAASTSSDAEVFRPLAAIINITVVIDVYLTADDEERTHSWSELTYFILSALHLTCKSTRHFEITVCMLFICYVSVYRCVCVCLQISMWEHRILSSLSVAFNVLIKIVTYCALIGQILEQSFSLENIMMMIVFTCDCSQVCMQGSFCTVLY